MKDKKLHMIGNAHIDPVWLWRWQEGFQEIKATFRSALDRLDESTDFIFTCSSAAFYEWIETNASAMFEEIRQRVKEGRWIIVGGWWVEPDCNIPSGESFVRQALYAQNYFKAKFGIMAKTGYNVDSFGHAGTLPQILKKSGLDNYVFMRPMPGEKGLPGRVFWWEANDGSKVLAYRIPYEYLSWGKDLHNHITRCAQEIKEPVDEMMCFYGVGNHGGGPTKENLESIRHLNGSDELPELVFSSPDRYFDELRTKNISCPVVHEDLQHHASGCYSAHSGIKRWNRRAEQVLIASEIFSVIAEGLTGHEYRNDFKEAWKCVLFNQFHDILAGTSIKEAYEDARNSFGKALTIGETNMNHALQAISWSIDIEENISMKPIVVFNPHSWTVKAPVEIEYGRVEEQSVLTNNEGNQIAFQLSRSSATANGRNKVVFTAEVPAFGYRVYKLYEKFTGERKCFEKVQGSQYTLENECFKVDIDEETGYIKGIHDKKEEFEVLSGYGAVPVIIEDNSDTWSHDVFKFDRRIGKFAVESVRLIEQGPVRSIISVKYKYGNSTIIQDFSIYRDLKGIYVKVTVDWHEKSKMLKLDFPVNVFFDKAAYEAPYGFIEKACNGEEEPGQRWIDLSGVARGKDYIYGLALANDSKYSYSVEKKTLSLTVLRSPIYAHHEPAMPQPGINYDYMDQGIQTFTYCLLPHKGTREESDISKVAMQVNSPLTGIVETYHKGRLPQYGAFINIDAANIVAGAMKKAENNDDIIIRLVEVNGVKTKTRIELPLWNREIETEFSPGEIKTFRIPQDNEKPLGEVNLIEL